ncbi:MAG TPA: VCBS repeat-containing protein [Verrucomicrobiae bacterium]
MNGSGAALGDFDGDGWCDIYFCNLGGENALYRNLGNWKFENVTKSAGVECAKDPSTGAVFADVNADGRLDLIVTALGGPNSLFINQGNGKFVDTAAAGGISSRLGAMSMAVGDVDGNGTLDLYICNYGATSILRSGGALNVSYVNGKPVVRGRWAQRIQIIGDTMFELGEQDALYLNDGTGKFKAVSWADGTFLDEDGKPLKEAPWDQGLAVMFRDVDGDRDPDIYVCNDAFTPDRFWINDGKGKFRSMSRLHWRSTSHSSMGVDFADYDRDGDDDFIVVDMLSQERRYLITQKGTIPPQPKVPGDLLTQVQIRKNTFYENRGDGTYAEIANMVGVAASEWSWNPVFIDMDLDGWEDLLISNGFPFNMDDMDTKEKVRAMGGLGVEQSRRTLLLYPKLDTPNMAFRNLRGKGFEQVKGAWGFDATEVSNGIALGDLDNDGDLDAVVNTFNGPGLVYRNDCAEPRVLVRLKGKAPNTQGIGAKIMVRGGPVEQSQEMIAGGRYASSDDSARMFACGGSAKMEIEVIWRNGTRSAVKNVLPNHIYEIDETGSTSMAPAAPAGSKGPTPLFKDGSNLLTHKHHETEFEDYGVQPTLPHKLSRPGPAIASIDLDRNGWDDLVIGAGRGGKLALFLNDEGRIRKVETAFTAPDDIAAIAALRRSDSTELILGVNNIETGITNTAVILEARGTNITQTGNLPVAAAVSTLALTNISEQPILFVGGHFVRGRYPEPAPSHLFVYSGEKWIEHSESKSVLAKLGTVTAATWTQLNDDAAPELLVACDWGGIRIFEFANNKLVDRTASWRIADQIGRWQSITAADVNRDGRIDFIAGNWGLNSFYNQATDGQVELFYGDFNNSGRIEILEAYRSAEGKSVPWRQMPDLAASLPWLRDTFRTHSAYAAASIDQILGPRLSSATKVRTTTLATTLFLNRGDHFEPIALPREAQFTPIFSISTADFDLDGSTDLFLSQNHFGTREVEGPLDAGRGLLLRGGGDGKFTAISGPESGIAAYGEQRASIATDLNKDGAPDLVVGQNGSETKLYLNSKKR